MKLKLCTLLCRISVICGNIYTNRYFLSFSLNKKRLGRNWDSLKLVICMVRRVTLNIHVSIRINIHTDMSNMLTAKCKLQHLIIAFIWSEAMQTRECKSYIGRSNPTSSRKTVRLTHATFTKRLPHDFTKNEKGWRPLVDGMMEQKNTSWGTRYRYGAQIAAFQGSWNYLTGTLTLHVSFWIPIFMLSGYQL